jgi:hypothetical protein
VSDPASGAPLCWICRTNPADSGEHRVKASDVRAAAPGISQKNPVFLQKNFQPTNIRVGSAKSKALMFSNSICEYCNSTRTQPYDVAWSTLSDYLRSNWAVIRRNGRFDLSKPFPGGTRKATLNVHLYFVKVFGCKLLEDKIPVDLAPFSDALMQGTAHPEVSVLVADDPVGEGKVLHFDSEVHTMAEKSSGELHGALWMYNLPPVAIKVAYIKKGARLNAPGHPWHPDKPSKIVKLGPYIGATEPIAGPRAIVEPDA